MTTKQNRQKTKITLDASEYLNASFIRSLVSSEPEVLIELVESAREHAKHLNKESVIESILRAYELIAKKILKDKKGSERPSSVILAAEEVLIQAKNIRGSIAANEAEKSALEMMILVFSIVHAEASEMLFEGAGRIAGRRKKKPTRRLLGVLGAINHFLDEDEKLTVQQLWEWRFKKLIKDDDPELDKRLRLFGADIGSDYEIYFYKDEDGDEIIQKETKKSGITVSGSIKYESFKKYVKKTKELRNEKLMVRY